MSPAWHAAPLRPSWSSRWNQAKPMLTPQCFLSRADPVYPSSGPLISGLCAPTSPFFIIQQMFIGPWLIPSHWWRWGNTRSKELQPLHSFPWAKCSLCTMTCEEGLEQPASHLALSPSSWAASPSLTPSLPRWSSFHHLCDAVTAAWNGLPPTAACMAPIPPGPITKAVFSQGPLRPSLLKAPSRIGKKVPALPGLCPAFISCEAASQSVFNSSLYVHPLKYQFCVC